jgi:SAM-dependent methyltransferase
MPTGEDYLEPYREAVDRLGPGFEATLWTSREAQRLRFDVMIDLAGFEAGVVVDAGCGTGDFAARLIERDVDFRRYVGVDAMEPMVESARDRGLDADRARVAFESGDFVADPTLLSRHEADFICFSGTLNTMNDETARGLIRGAFDAANHGVVFNFLSDRCHERFADRDLTPARRFDTAAWLDWSLHQTPLVSFTQDYLDGHDATILLRK